MAEDTDPVRSNLDNDQAYEEEPISDVNGASQDIGVLIAGDLPDIHEYHDPMETGAPQLHANPD